MFKKTLDRAEAGDQLGALLRGVKKDDLKRGMILSKPNTLNMHNHFKAQVIFHECEFLIFISKVFIQQVCVCVFK